MEEVTLAEALISIDTSQPDGIDTALDYIEGWCSGRDLPVQELHFEGRRCLRVAVGDAHQEPFALQAARHRVGGRCLICGVAVLTPAGRHLKSHRILQFRSGPHAVRDR